MTTKVPGRMLVSEAVNVRDFMTPAEKADTRSGTPVLDVSAAAQAAYNTTAKTVSWEGVIAAKIGAKITSAVSGRQSIGYGALITATASMDCMLEDNGTSKSAYSGFILDGASLACKGIRAVNAVDIDVSHNDIRNIRSVDDRVAAAIFCTVEGGGGRFIGNRITNVSHPGNGVFTDNNGSARGIHITGTAVSGAGFVVYGNVIDSITGEEGDAIHVIAFDTIALPYLSAKVSVCGNTINNASRRAIKLQSMDVTACGNVITYDLPFTGSNRNTEAAIDLLSGRRVAATGNTINGANYVAGIRVLGSGAARVRNGAISANTIQVGNFTSWVDDFGNAKPVQAGIITDFCDAITITGNSIEGAAGGQIQVKNCFGVIASENTLIASGASTVGVLVQTSNGCIVSNNTGSLDGVSGTYNSLVTLNDADTNVVRGNRLNVPNTSTAFAVNFLTAPVGNLVTENCNNSTAQAPLGGTVTGNVCVHNRNLNGTPAGTPDITQPYQVAALGVANLAAATTPGSVIRRMPVYDQFGGLVGYAPIYNNIT